MRQPSITPLVRHRAPDAEGADALGDGIQDLGRGLGEARDRRLTGNGVDGHGLGPDAAQGLQPGADVLLASVVHADAVNAAGEKDRLTMT